jgi:hypothetical protein
MDHPTDATRRPNWIQAGARRVVRGGLFEVRDGRFDRLPFRQLGEHAFWGH